MLRSFAAVLTTAAFASTLVPAAANAPAWWSDPSTSIAGSSSVNDWAPANLGQLKNVATQAMHYLNLRLAGMGGAGPAVTTMCQFSQADNYAPATVGQLKSVAKVFYDRLAEVGYDRDTGGFAHNVGESFRYPWFGISHPENNAPVNIGQLKNVFAFDISGEFLAMDNDQDGMPSCWELTNGLNPYSPDDGEDPDGDGIVNRMEYQLDFCQCLVTPLNLQDLEAWEMQQL